MIRRLLLTMAAGMVLACVAAVPDARAQWFYSGEGKPNVFNYGWRGLYIGALGGLGAGYLRYADSGNNDDILRSVVWGSLIGTGVGLAAGFADTSSGVKGTGDLVLYDMGLGGWFGLGVGTIIGGLNAAIGNDWKYLGKGAAWGYLGGLVLGAGLGIYESTRTVQTVPVSSGVRQRVDFYADSKGGMFPALVMDYKF